MVFVSFSDHCSQVLGLPLQNFSVEQSLAICRLACLLTPFLMFSTSFWPLLELCPCFVAVSFVSPQLSSFVGYVHDLLRSSRLDLPLLPCCHCTSLASLPRLTSGLGSCKEPRHVRQLELCVRFIQPSFYSPSVVELSDAI